MQERNDQQQLFSIKSDQRKLVTYLRVISHSIIKQSTMTRPQYNCSDHGHWSTCVHTLYFQLSDQFKEATD